MAKKFKREKRAPRLQHLTTHFNRTGIGRAFICAIGCLFHSLPHRLDEETVV
jgi:hypothetical protein